MICVNELSDLNSRKKKILEQLLILLAPYAPHISEELWQSLGHHETILDASYPVLEEKYLIETSVNYPVAVNGKTRSSLSLAPDIAADQAEVLALADPFVQKWLEGKPPKKVIFVRNKMINIVV